MNKFKVGERVEYIAVSSCRTWGGTVMQGDVLTVSHVYNDGMFHAYGCGDYVFLPDKFKLVNGKHHLKEE